MPVTFELAELSISLVFLAFSVSVLICVCLQFARSNAVFTTGFFLIYAIHSVADIAELLFVSHVQGLGRNLMVCFKAETSCFILNKCKIFSKYQC